MTPYPLLGDRNRKRRTHSVIHSRQRVPSWSRIRGAVSIYDPRTIRSGRWSELIRRCSLSAGQAATTPRDLS
jgi:hypothetical protein